MSMGQFSIDFGPTGCSMWVDVASLFGFLQKCKPTCTQTCKQTHNKQTNRRRCKQTSIQTFNPSIYGRRNARKRLNLLANETESAQALSVCVRVSRFVCVFIGLFAQPSNAKQSRCKAKQSKAMRSQAKQSSSKRCKAMQTNAEKCTCKQCKAVAKRRKAMQCQA